MARSAWTSRSPPTIERKITAITLAPFVDPNQDTTRISTTLFDTVAVYLAASEDLVDLQTLPMRVTNEGYTVNDPAKGRPVRCAVVWKDLQAYEQLLVDTLLG
jgi:hypothetical protein